MEEENQRDISCIWDCLKIGDEPPIRAIKKWRKCLTIDGHELMSIISPCFNRASKFKLAWQVWEAPCGGRILVVLRQGTGVERSLVLRGSYIIFCLQPYSTCPSREQKMDGTFQPQKIVWMWQTSSDKPSLIFPWDIIPKWSRCSTFHHLGLLWLASGNQSHVLNIPTWRMIPARNLHLQ